MAISGEKENIHEKQGLGNEFFEMKANIEQVQFFPRLHIRLRIPHFR
jgi:hypothetical protein